MRVCCVIFFYSPFYIETINSGEQGRMGLFEIGFYQYKIQFKLCLSGKSAFGLRLS